MSPRRGPSGRVLGGPSPDASAELWDSRGAGVVERFGSTWASAPAARDEGRGSGPGRRRGSGDATRPGDTPASAAYHVSGGAFRPCWEGEKRPILGP